MGVKGEGEERGNGKNRRATRTYAEQGRATSGGRGKTYDSKKNKGGDVGELRKREGET